MPILEKHLTQVLSDVDKSSNYSDHQPELLVFKFWTIGGIFLYMFSDALLFDMMLNTAFQDGIDTIQDLVDRDMSIGTSQK